MTEKGLLLEDCRSDRRLLRMRRHSFHFRQGDPWSRNNLASRAPDGRIALLIDVENIPYGKISSIFAELANMAQPYSRLRRLDAA